MVAATQEADRTHRRAQASFPAARARESQNNDQASSPRWLRGLTWFLAACSLRHVYGAQAPAPALPGSPQSGIAPLGARGLPAATVWDVTPLPAILPADVAALKRCWQADAEPDMAAFLGFAAPAGASWQPASVPLWGQDEAVLGANATLKARDARALGPDDAPRAAVLGSILGQKPSVLRAFVAPVEGNDTLVRCQLRVNVGAFVPDPRTLSLAFRNTLPTLANGTAVAYGDRGGSWHPLLGKLDAKLAACQTPIRFRSTSEVLQGVLGSGDGSPESGPLTYTRVFTSLSRTGARLFGAVTFSGKTAGGDAPANLTDGNGTLTLHDAQRAVSLELAVGSPYGLLRVQQFDPPAYIELFNPWGQGGIADGYLGGRNTSVVRVPLDLATNLEALTYVTI